MSKYELAVVVSANVEEEVKNQTIEQVKELVTRFGGNVTEVEDCGKKRLAYDIQKMKDAFYYFVKFEAEAGCPAEVESRIRIMENVIRFLIVKDGE